MRKIRFSDLSVRVINITFNTRFVLARACQKLPPLEWMIDKMFFEGDDIQVLPRDAAIKNHQSGDVMELEVNAIVPTYNENTLVPSQVLKEMIKRSIPFYHGAITASAALQQLPGLPHDLGCLF